ncbi:MAG: nitroreductase family protein [Acidobacteriota bacterium]|nr:nitroreductase family protein [Acidobacteriota bacterium]
MATTTTNVPDNLHELIRTRWSPRDFSDRAIEPAKLRSLFEAARWAASCFNEQPWRFLVATKARPEQFQRVLGLLVEKNQQWAKTAYALGFSAGKKTFSHNGAPNRFNLHDAGAAAANLALEATALGLRTHFMGGFDAQKARTEFHVPDDFEIGAAFAIGYIDETAVQPGPRTRRPLEEIVFSGDWGAPSPELQR